MIWIAFEKDGLYHFTQASPKTQSIEQTILTPSTFVVTESQLDFWHRRLGHVSSSRLPYLKQIDPSISVDTHVCEISPLEKQRKLSFPISQSKSNKMFDSIHCDI